MCCCETKMHSDAFSPPNILLLTRKLKINVRDVIYACMFLIRVTGLVPVHGVIVFAY